MSSAHYSSQSGNFVVRVIGTLVVAEFFSKATRGDFAELTTMMKEISSTLGQFSSLTVAPPTATMLDANARHEIALQQELLRGSALASAIIVPTGSLTGFVVRSIVPLLTAFTDTSRVKVFSATSEALAWLQSVPGQNSAVKALTVADLGLKASK